MKLRLDKPTRMWATTNGDLVTFVFERKTTAIACADDRDIVERVEVLVRRVKKGAGRG